MRQSDVPICGVQLLQCNHYPIGNSIHTGIESQEIKVVAEILGLFTKWTKKGWRKTIREDPDGDYDLNEATIIYQKALGKLNERMHKIR